MIIHAQEVVAEYRLLLQVRALVVQVLSWRDKSSTKRSTTANRDECARKGQDLVKEYHYNYEAEFGK
jgi:hypothetical protein